MAEYIEYHPLKFWLDPASIAEIVAHIQAYLVANPINSTAEIETIIHDYLIAHPELIGGVDSVNGQTGEVVLTADNISGGENVTIKDVLDSLQDQIDDIVASIPSDYQQLIDDVSDLKSATDSLSNRISCLHDAVTYWGNPKEYPKDSSGAGVFYVKQCMTELVLDGAIPETTANYRFKLDGELQRTTSSNTAKAWIGTLNLIKDHVYRLTVKLMSGSVADVNANINFQPLFSIQGNGSQQGAIVKNTSYSNPTYVSKDIRWTLDNTPAALQIYISKGSGTVFTYATYQVLCDDVTAEYADPSVIINRNYQNEVYYQAYSRTNNSEKGTNLIRLAHITDTHSDSKAWERFMAFNEYINPHVTAIIHTGDIVKSDMRDDYTYITDHLSDDIPTLLTIGNHDAGNDQPVGSGGATNATCKEVFITPLVTKYGIVTPNDDSACYYYKDLKSDNDARTLRVIVLNVYDYDDNTSGTFVDRTHIHYKQAQIDWLTTVLQDANANNIPVCICAHDSDAFLSVSDGLDNPFDIGYDTSATTSSGDYLHYKDWTGNPICDLVEAFIDGSSVSGTYDQGDFTVTLNATFANAGHFVAWFTGHRHSDHIGFLPGYKQLVITPANGGMTVTAKYSDLPRWDNTKSEDCFNMYSINLATHTIGIARIGSDVIYSGKERRNTSVTYIKS